MYQKFSSQLNKPHVGLLVLRIVFAGSMMTHGFAKLSRFAEMADTFPDPYGMGHPLSLTLAVFAEFFCSLAVLLGFYTRLALVPLIVTMVTAGFVVHGGAPFEKRELALLYLGAFVALLFQGSGKFGVKREG